jgi:hypothetical protein
MRRWFGKSTITRRRGVVLITLFAFVAGNIGVPIVPGKCAATTPANPEPAAVTYVVATCCCGHKGAACTCGCCRRPAADVSNAAPGRCCKARTETGDSEEKPHDEGLLIVTCPCGGAADAGFVVSVLPKLTATSVQLPELVDVSPLDCADLTGAPTGGLAPETPPPRPSAC